MTYLNLSVSVVTSEFTIFFSLFPSCLRIKKMFQLIEPLGKERRTATGDGDAMFYSVYALPFDIPNIYIQVKNPGLSL